MNRLRGHIVSIESSGHVSLVDIEVCGGIFSAILLETPESSRYLAAGNEVAVLFKETEVSLAKSLSGLISLRNRLPVRIKNIRRGDILSEVELDYAGQAIASIITTRAVDRLGLNAGDAVEALIKANEVSLMEVP
jgi:molybdate transport system regulatory protein